MNGAETWGEAITLWLIRLGEDLINFLPALVGALLVFIAGWIIAMTLGKLVERAIHSTRIDKAIEKMGVKKNMGVAAGYTIAELFGGLVKWFLALVFLMAAADILNLNQVADFLSQIVRYLPNVLVAVIILTVVTLVGNFVATVVRGSTAAAGVVSATLLAAIARWAIVIFGIFAALIQLGIASSLVNTIFVGLVAMLALAGGLAFGLGGRDEASLILKKIREEVTHKSR
jgi:hypothetical protein